MNQQTAVQERYRAASTGTHPLDLTADEVRDMQEKDDLLAAAVGGVSTARMGFFE